MGLKERMTNDPISVVDLADQAGKRRQSIFKLVARLNIQTTKQRSASSKGQLIAYVSYEDAQLILAELRQRSELDATSSISKTADIAVSDAELGVFYLLALEPIHDPGRFKLGFAASLSERLQKHRCAAPLLQVVGYWPCKRLWEKTAIDAISVGCERLHTEVFRTSSMSTVVERCQAFFSLMPTVAASANQIAGPAQLALQADVAHRRLVSGTARLK
ncbi:MAG: hypothetical protein M0Q15_16700 [Nevskia sp.]|nr:hypothetical protein [Nevskia sp.]